MTTVLLLAPGTPMVFQGQEFDASTPFLYFADHGGELGAAVAKGRKEFLTQFPSLAASRVCDGFAVPHAPETFERCKLDLDERRTNAGAYAMFKELLRLRREDPAFRAQRGDRIHGAVIGPEAFLLRWVGEAAEERLLLCNLGSDLSLGSIAEPLAAPPAGRQWRVLFTTEDPKWGGCGTPEVETPEGWHVQGHAAVVLTAVERGGDGW